MCLIARRIGGGHNGRMFEPSSVPLRRLVWIALALSLGAAVSLGITRFAYGLLLPVMRADLQWGSPLAGALNTGA